MILKCATPGHETAADRWTPEQPYWDCTSPDGRTTLVACLDHTIDLELTGWTSKRIKTQDDLLAAQRWGADVGMN